MVVNIRRLEKKDLLTVLEIENLTQLSPWSEEIFNRCLDMDYFIWVMETDKIIGFTVYSLQAHECHILNLNIHPDYQHQGYGNQLMLHALQEAKTAGMTMVILEVRRSNKKAIALYHKLGFSQIGERKAYYPPTEDKPSEDAFVFALDLISY